MDKQYYLNVKTEYVLYYDEDGNVSKDKHVYSDYKSFSKSFDSDFFNTKQDCVNFGNKLISANKWIEQFPGYVNQLFSTTFDIYSVRLKNGVCITITIKTKNNCDFETLNNELQKFNIESIESEVK